MGGVTWFTPDDASTSCFTPLYCGITALPAPYVKGDYKKFEWDSAWWVSNLVSAAVTIDGRGSPPTCKPPSPSEKAHLLKMQPVIEEAAVKLGATEPRLDREFLTNYSVLPARRSSATGKVWPSPPNKHVDGYVKSGQGRAEGSRLLSGMAQARRRRPARTVQSPDEVQRDRSLRKIRSCDWIDRACGRIWGIDGIGLR